MARTKIRFISKGFRDVLRSDGTKAAVRSTTERLASAAGDGVRASSFTMGSGRPAGLAITTAQDSDEADAQREALEAAVLGMG